MKLLNRHFFNRDTMTVARNLLGTRLVREFDGQILSGMIAETEAYLGSNDSASHASRGRTPRNAVMFDSPGKAYVYFVYGMHFLFNIVTEAKGIAGAVLIRSIVPLQGVHWMEANRNRKGKDLANGPAKLCQALAIDKALNRWDLTVGKRLWLEPYKAISAASIGAGPRVGISYAKPEDREAHRRFWVIADNSALSKTTDKGQARAGM